MLTRSNPRRPSRRGADHRGTNHHGTNQRGASLVELTLFLPLAVAVFYGSLMLTEVGVFRLRAQEVARYAAFGLAARPLHRLEADRPRHDDAFREARDGVRAEIGELYVPDLDGSRSRLVPVPGQTGMTSSAALLPLTNAELANAPADLLPEFADVDFAEPLSALGLGLSMLGLGPGLEDIARGVYDRLGMNTSGQVTGRAKVMIRPPWRPVDAERGQALSAVAARQGASLRAFLPREAGRLVRGSQGGAIALTLVGDPWRLHDGSTARSDRDAPHELVHVVRYLHAHVQDALPGAGVMNWFVGLSGSTPNFTTGLDAISEQLALSSPKPQVFARAYATARTQAANPRGTPLSGQVALFDEVRGRPESGGEGGPVVNFETLPLFDSADSPASSRLWQMFRPRGANFMGCPHAEERRCAR